MVGQQPLWPRDLDARRDDAHRMLSDCRLCSRACGVDRTASADGAWCRLGAEAYAYKELLSHGEEACVSPTWLIDLSGCSLRCLFCTEWSAITQPVASPAVPLRAGWFLRRLSHHLDRGARTLSFVGGEPTVNLAGVLHVLAAVPPAQQLPIVWNTNGLIGAQAWPLLEGLVHTWVIDLKVGSQAAARRLLGAADLDYGGAVRACLDRIHASMAVPAAGTTWGRPQAAKSPQMLVIRHLLLPGASTAETALLLREVAERWPLATLNLMTMYLPFGPALRHSNAPSELRSMVDVDQRDAAVRAARRLQLRLLVDGRSAEG